MKILLVGEFSGVHNNLKKGLIELGHDVILAADGDGFKSFGYDLRLKPFVYKQNDKIYNILFNIIYMILNYIYILANFKKFIGYDIVQFISPFSLSSLVYYSGLIKIIFHYNKKVFYYACGTDPNYINAVKDLKYSPYSHAKKFWKIRLKYHKWFINHVDGIIPATYTYYLGYKDNKLVKDIIKLPSSGEFRSIEELKINSKRKILFGITRREFKGAEYILEALSIIESEYSDLVDINIVERISIKEYLEHMDATDILIDQCKSYCYGMNALYALQRGVITLSGSEDLANEFMNISTPVVLNIIPNVSQIVNQLKNIILSSGNSILEMKISSIYYAKKHHDLIKISSEFIYLYENE